MAPSLWNISPIKIRFALTLKAFLSKGLEEMGFPGSYGAYPLFVWMLLGGWVDGSLLVFEFGGLIFINCPEFLWVSWEVISITFFFSFSHVEKSKYASEIRKPN